VAVAETEVPGATDRIVLGHSHFGLVFSADVAEAVARFLRTGRLSQITQEISLQPQRHRDTETN